MEEKSLIEVRKWKDAVYEDYKNLNLKQTQKKLEETTNRIMKRYNLNVKFSDKKGKEKKAI